MCVQFFNAPNVLSRRHIDDVFSSKPLQSKTSTNFYLRRFAFSFHELYKSSVHFIQLRTDAVYDYKVHQNHKLRKNNVGVYYQFKKYQSKKKRGNVYLFIFIKHMFIK